MGMGKPTLTNVQIRKIIQLRREGRSIPEIQQITGHGKTTIFRYVQGVQILPRFMKYWENRRRSSTYRMMSEFKKAEIEAQSIIQSSKNLNKIIGAVCLYWAEGAKRDFSLSNTDPRLIKIFVECISIFGVSKDHLRITLRLYEDLNSRLAIDYWAGVIGVPKTQITNINILKGKKKGKLKYGMCRVRIIRGGYLLKIIKSLINLMPQII